MKKTLILASKNFVSYFLLFDEATIYRKKFIEYRGGVYAPRPYCAGVLYEMVTAKFHNGLTLQSEEHKNLGEVSMELCDSNM
jgi:hypothetical protein